MTGGEFGGRERERRGGLEAALFAVEGAAQECAARKKISQAVEIEIGEGDADAGLLEAEPLGGVDEFKFLHLQENTITGGRAGVEVGEAVAIEVVERDAFHGAGEFLDEDVRLECGVSSARVVRAVTGEVGAHADELCGRAVPRAEHGGHGLTVGADHLGVAGIPFPLRRRLAEAEVKRAGVEEQFVFAAALAFADERDNGLAGRNVSGRGWAGLQCTGHGFDGGDFDHVADFRGVAFVQGGDADEELSGVAVYAFNLAGEDGLVALEKIGRLEADVDDGVERRDEEQRENAEGDDGNEAHGRGIRGEVGKFYWQEDFSSPEPERFFGISTLVYFFPKT